MKKLFALGCFVLAMTLCMAATAAPLLTNGSYTAYLSQNNWLYLVSPDGSERYLKTTITDVVGIDEEKMYCLTSQGSLWSVNLDGSASSVVAQRPRESDFAAVEAPAVFHLDGTVLTLASNGETLSTSAVYATANTQCIYYVEMSQNGVPVLCEKPLDASSSGRTMEAGAPIAMNASNDYVVLVLANHNVQVIELACWGMLEFPAVSDQTGAAIFVKNNLIRFTVDATGNYMLEDMQEVHESFVPTPSPRPTVTPRPTATMRPAVTAQPEKAENEIVMHYGDSGDAVAAMQARLVELEYLTAVTGVFDEATLEAVNLFQYTIGYAERDYVTERLLNVMNSQAAPGNYFYSTLYENDRGTPVRLMQQALNKLGYELDVTGIYDKVTVRMVANFLNDQGIADQYAGTVMEHLSQAILYTMAQQ